MRVSILASGSKGNASLYEAGSTRLLVDGGIGLRAIAAHTPSVDGILITHAHSDHVGNSLRLARKLKAPLYLTEATARVVRPACEHHIFAPREPFMVGALQVAPIPLPHDAAQVGLVIAHGSTSVGLATDLGEVPPGLVEHFRGCDALLIESNHDIDMLEEGPYPIYLQRRIRSAGGHLSNEQTAALLRALYEGRREDEGPHTVVLMHLSEKNNDPQLAMACATEALTGRRVRLLCASQRTPLLFSAARPEEPFAALGRRRPEQAQLTLSFG